MKKRIPQTSGTAFILLIGVISSVHAAPPWKSFIPFRRGVEADQNQPYRLREENGPWVIMTTSFMGAGAEQQAHKLVLELRERYRLSAYVHKRSFDFTKPVRGVGLNPDGTPKMMRYANASKHEEYAVLVGDFESFNSPAAQKALKKLKYARPECLELRRGVESHQRFAVLRELHRRIQTDEEKKNKGPMGNSFVTRNPLLPAEYFAPDGLNSLVVDMNRGVDHSLLDNPSKYTVRVASFRGRITMDQDEIARIEDGAKMDSKLEEAAVNAHKLTTALRRQGYEAYEFHDLHESIVTVGSFESVGQPRGDGKIEINRAVHEVMQTFGAKRQDLPGKAVSGLVPKTLDGIPFDVQPMPVKVPRQSVAATYAAGNGYSP